MFKALLAALALSLFACAAEPAAEATASNDSEIVQTDVITVVAVAKVKPGTREAFEAAGLDLVRGTRLEDGNVSYTMLEGKDDPNTFIFIEEWASQAAIDAHMNGPVLGAFFSLVKDSFEEGYPQITPLSAVAQNTTGTTVAR